MKKKVFKITGIICLLPLIPTIVLYRKLPMIIAVQFSDGNVTNTLPRFWGTVGIISFMFFLHCIIYFSNYYYRDFCNLSEIFLYLFFVPLLNNIILLFIFFEALKPIVLALDTILVSIIWGSSLVGLIFYFFSKKLYLL